MALSMRSTTGARPVLRASRSSAVRVVCQAQREQESSPVIGRHLAATLVATSLLAGGMMMPEEALAAKSSGRVGGSSGFAARKAPAPARSQSRTVVNNTTIVAAPPVYASPFGFGGFGFSFMPTFFMPIPMFGGLFQIFFLLIIVSVVFNVIRAFTAGQNNNKKDDGSWGDL